MAYAVILKNPPYAYTTYETQNTSIRNKCSNEIHENIYLILLLKPIKMN